MSMEETTHNIETFVAKLQKDGVEAGRIEAEKIVSEANREGQRIIKSAEEKAVEIVKSAEIRAQKVRTQAQKELGLAARDAVLKLRQAIETRLSAIVFAEVQKDLAQPGFLQGLIAEVVRQYAGCDAANLPMMFSIPQHVLKKHQEQLQSALSAEIAEGKIQLTGGSQQTGLEYKVGQGTVEVTPESVAEVLLSMVGKDLTAAVHDIKKG